jgi:hypothetical protein
VLIIGALTVAILVLGFIRPKALQTLQEPTEEAIEGRIRRVVRRSRKRFNLPTTTSVITIPTEEKQKDGVDATAPEAKEDKR